jgi:RHH-type proline utilization regulon transcriptional repressor/proline dehydrogenase/delta 1-pyrroline-5-carboxylate dehydrogenase
MPEADMAETHPFAAFCRDVVQQGELRARITAAHRRPEPECVPPLIAAARLPEAVKAEARATAHRLATAFRAKQKGAGVEALIREYDLSSDEGVSLMCLAEALLRIPDAPTRDALIRDKIGGGDWRSHLGHSPSLFVNAATWGLIVAGRLTSTASEDRLSDALLGLVARGGEPVIRSAVDLAMRMMGEQFVMGRTIEEALVRSRPRQRQGFAYSFDMLGEAAMTAADAQRYFAAYEGAIESVGNAAAGRGVDRGPGISIKLSALHPRFSRAQRQRVMAELLPRLTALVTLARRHDVGVNIDAEEADRLDLSLDLLEALCFAPALDGWSGIGFVVQAYQKRAPFVVDYLVDLAQRSRHRLMIRLVKGAYWDSEIKRAQVDGLEGFPVFTRKIYTDVCYLVCARRLLGAIDRVYPQFATHNALTLATVHAMAKQDGLGAPYEFQCLHGMGEPLYEEVVGPNKLDRQCRIYAPIGTHETLLAYLVRRLLENGANSSFVNRIGNPEIGIDALLADPVDTATALVPQGAPHPDVLLPRHLYGQERANSAGLDLASEGRLAELAGTLSKGGAMSWSAAPMLADGPQQGVALAVTNPSRRDDVVGTVVHATADMIETAFRSASAAPTCGESWPPADRARHLNAAADLLEQRMPALVGLIVREAGRSLPASVAEVREAVDYLRYYAARARELANDPLRPLGIVVCISPWNFPLAIFTGQVAAALAAGNMVLAKPAEETPLIAAQAIAILHEAGVPAHAVQLLPGDGKVGAALVRDPRTSGVIFTGSTEVARLIQAELAKRLGPDGRPVPLIAETGGQNAMIVDSSALSEQVVGDVLASAFDSAGQRCSALRILCLQDDVADRILDMLRGALRELEVANPDRLSTDVGPVITATARGSILDHACRMAESGHRVESLPLGPDCEAGSFVAPTIIDIDRIADVGREVFGPVLHVMRFRREELDRLVDDINATGYALTFAVHSRIDETIERVRRRIAAGNVYVNRNMIGAVVGTQPFGGHGLSGTGPKAGGPLYLRRLVIGAHPPKLNRLEAPSAQLLAWVAWLTAKGYGEIARRCRRFAEMCAVGAGYDLPGPVGERNTYLLAPRGVILCRARSVSGLFLQIGAALATGNVALLDAPASAVGLLQDLPQPVCPAVLACAARPDAPVAAALVEGGPDDVLALLDVMAKRPGPIVPVLAVAVGDPDETWPLLWLLQEQTVTVNTAAAGGNATLMTLN